MAIDMTHRQELEEADKHRLELVFMAASCFSDWWENAQVNFSRALQDLVKKEMESLPSHPNFFTPSTSGNMSG